MVSTSGQYFRSVLPVSTSGQYFRSVLTPEFADERVGPVALVVVPVAAADVHLDAVGDAAVVVRLSCNGIGSDVRRGDQSEQRTKQTLIWLQISSEKATYHVLHGDQLSQWTRGDSEFSGTVQMKERESD